ncbi:MAG: hypothetical protein AAB573_02895 [Patescibacteria group bacterium]
MQRYAMIEKLLGETPLQAIERYRSSAALSRDTPLAYAGRLDPMATGKLLVLIGDECKVQTKYHMLDKKYEFEVLFGFQSDTHDILGLAESHTTPSDPEIRSRTQKCTGTITLPFPRFSARTVRGIPLHMHTLSGSLRDDEVPTKTSTVYSLRRTQTRTMRGDILLQTIFEKINSFPEVTDVRKTLGRDFRRADIRARWHELLDNNADTEYTVATFSCTASSGSYMRSLAHALGGLALSIQRTKIGRYVPLPFNLGVWVYTY